MFNLKKFRNTCFSFILIMFSMYQAIKQTLNFSFTTETFTSQFTPSLSLVLQFVHRYHQPPTCAGLSMFHSLPFLFTYKTNSFHQFFFFFFDDFLHRILPILVERIVMVYRIIECSGRRKLPQPNDSGHSGTQIIHMAVNQRGEQMLELHC